MALSTWLDLASKPGRHRLLLTLPAIGLLTLVAWLVWESETGANYLDPVVNVEFASSDDLTRPSNEQWYEVVLPLRFCQVVRCRAAFEWARHDFLLETLPDQRWGLYMPQFESAVHVFLNGARIAELGHISGHVSNYRGHPQLVVLPADKLLPGKNRLEFQFGEVAWGFGKLSPFYLGPIEQLEDAFFIRDRTQNGLLGSAVFLMLPILLFTVVFAFFGERDPILIAFAGLLFFYLLRTANGLLIDQWFSHAGHVFVYFLATLGLLATAYGFIARWTGGVRITLEMFVWAAAGLSLLYIGYVLYGDVRLGIIRGNAITRYGVLLLVPYLLFMVVRYLIHSPSWPVATVAGALATTAFLAIFDAIRSWPPAMPDAYYAGLGPPLLVFAFAVELAFRVAEKSRAVGLANQKLTRRVSAREAELAENYLRLKEIEDEQLLSHERQRIMRDMHDGVGGRLAALSNQMRKESVTPGRVQAAVQESLQDLRLLISSLDPRLTILVWPWVRCVLACRDGYKSMMYSCNGCARWTARGMGHKQYCTFIELFRKLVVTRLGTASAE